MPMPPTPAALCAEFDAFLLRTGLPSMCAHNLWCEMIAVRNGLNSNYVVSAEARAACTDENCAWVLDLLRRWDEVEA